MSSRKHKDRKHAQWSASATERNWLCPGNIALAQDVVSAPESKAAAWGTACHEVAERLLHKDVPIDIGDEISTERHVFWIDQEMMECANVYVDYIRGRMQQGYNLHAVEQQFSLKNMELSMDIGGTADAVLHDPHLKSLEIVDLKTGKGKWVDAQNNPQERLYALGVLVSLDLGGMPVKEITTTIVQPRYGDAPVRSETFHITELMDWTIDLVPRVNMAAEAFKAYAVARDIPPLLDHWVDTFLVPGEVQCQFCPAAGGCPALRKRALEIVDQDNYGHAFQSIVLPNNSVEAVEADLDMLELIEAWIRERRALAHEMAIKGAVFDHHVLVEKTGYRKFIGINEADTVAKIRGRIHLTNEQLYDQKLKSPSGLEKAIGKKAVESHLADLIVRPVTGTDLIRSTHTGRAAAVTVTDLLEHRE